MVKIVDMGDSCIDRYVVCFEDGNVVGFMEEGLGEPLQIFPEQMDLLGGKTIPLDDCPKPVIEGVQWYREGGKKRTWFS